jgi:hypothetical protein
MNEGKYSSSRAIEGANELTSELYEVEQETVDLGYATTERKIEGEWANHNVDTNEKVDHVPDVGKKAEYTRPFNPKVVEIFNEYLPKEIAPLAIEAHKRSCELHSRWLADFGVLREYTLRECLFEGVNWAVNSGFEALCYSTIKNTITATEEQLREWFPSAYQNEGGNNV